MYKKMFEEYDMNGMNIKNRFLLAPMTRSRADEKTLIPKEIMADYYGQRASAGLLISEATQISLQGQGYAKTPGIYSQGQIDGWKPVTKAVHNANSKIFLQLWHVGRVSSSQVNGLQPLAPSALKAKDTNVYIFDGVPNGDATFIPVEQPKSMSQNDIDHTIKDFVNGAKNALKAGFDGVEIHGANGYLIDQFLRSNSNTRNDEYGGSKEKRGKFLIDTVKAVISEVNSKKVGVRLSPFISFKDMSDPDILDTIMMAVKELNKLDIIYIHLCEADWDDAPQIPLQFRKDLRNSFKNTIIATGNKSIDEAEELLEQDLVDLVGFGRKFIANPDYPQRIERQAPIAEITNNHALFGVGTSQGYSDYPFYTIEE